MAPRPAREAGSRQLRPAQALLASRWPDHHGYGASAAAAGSARRRQVEAPRRAPKRGLGQRDEGRRPGRACPELFIAGRGRNRPGARRPEKGTARAQLWNFF
jgi:hypothetical protein